MIPAPPQTWTYQKAGLFPAGNVSVSLLSAEDFDRDEEFLRFRREFPGIGTGFSEGRIRELYLGRKCARAAILERFGEDPGWIGAGTTGMPELPPGVCASLSHSTIDGKLTAAVALAEKPECIGIDLEPVLSTAAAKKLERRYGEALPRDRRNPEGMTELFTIYETVVKIASQMGLGKPVPAQIELMEKSDRDDPIDWVARLKVEQIVVFHGVSFPLFHGDPLDFASDGWTKPRTSVDPHSPG